MTYQTLVVKDTNTVNKWWKWSIVSLLFLVLVSSLTTSFSFHSLMLNFNTNCPTASQIRFKNYNVSEIDATDTSAVLALASFPTAHYQRDQLNAERLQILSRKLHEHIDKRRRNEKIMDPLERMLKYMDIKEKNRETTHRQTMDDQDIQFFDSQIIDEFNTIWGSEVSCDYLAFIPLIAAITAAVWLVLFVMCGNGGQSKHSFVEEAWRIVLPAITFFLVMTIIACVHLYMMMSRLNDFCDSLKTPFNDHTIGCGLLLDRFSLSVQVDPSAGRPSANYLTTVVSTWTNLFLWSVAVVIMMLRCFYGTDFELVDMPPKNDYHCVQIEQNGRNEKNGIDADEVTVPLTTKSSATRPSTRNVRRDIEMGEYGTMKTSDRLVEVDEGDFVAAELCVPENNIVVPMTAMSAWPQERRKLINEVHNKVKETKLNV